MPTAWMQLLAITVSVVATVTMLGHPLASAAPQATAPYLPPATQVDKAVPGTNPAPSAAPATHTGRAYDAPAPVWPAAGTGEVAVAAAGLQPLVGGLRPTAAGGSIQVGGLPVTIGGARHLTGANADRVGSARSEPAGAAATPTRVRVQVLNQAQSHAAGINGVLLRVGRTDSTSPGTARVRVDYGAFRYAYGADWAARLRLVALPECALATPGAAACSGIELASDNDPATSSVSADVELPPAAAVTAPAAAGAAPSAAAMPSIVGTGGVMLALTAGTSSGAGSYAATSLQPSATWSAGTNSGGFTWSYPMRVPPALNGPAPQVALGYSSQGVDGRMATTNNQPSWIGEGFESGANFIERRYKPCDKDKTGGNNSALSVGDLCWVRDNAIMSLNGSGSELIFKSGNEWRKRSDDAWRIQHLPGAGNGAKDGEYWVVTAVDGTQYWFGGKAASNATWTVPVFGNHTDEPCNASTFAASWCAQAWRWNLDYVVDTDGNTMTYTYVKETNQYAKNMTSGSPASYTRGGYLDHIDYGSRAGSSATAPMRVKFTVADRCMTSSCATHTAPNWPDTPWDQQCAATPCMVGSPTFWTTKRLSKVTTQLHVSGTTYRDVEWWTLAQSFPDPGDGTRAGLWLDKISHSGQMDARSVAVGPPDVRFVGQQLQNRVDSTVGDWALPMNWFRIKTITTETGGTVNVSYAPTNCAAPGNLPAQAETNTQRCYPVKWTPPGHAAVNDWFHTYVVATVTQEDLGLATAVRAPRVITSYEYVGGAAWHYTDDDGLVDDDGKTWSVWRGYGTVRATMGDPGQQQVTETRSFRGMNGDKLPVGTRSVTLAAVGSYAAAVKDEDAFAGMTRESIVYNGVTELSGQVSEPWQSAATATRTIGTTVSARYVQTAKTWNRVTLDGGRGQRVSGTVTTFGAYGMADRSEDLGDIAVMGDEQCTVNTHEPRNTSAWLISYEQRVQTFTTACATATGGGSLTVDNVMTDNRTWYDNATSYGTAPTKGNPTKVEVLNTWTPGPGGGNPGTPGYLVTSTSTYDAWGRVIRATDVKNSVTTTEYTHNSAGQLASTKVTNPLLWDTTTTFEPASGAAIKSVDPNGHITEELYDGLGRLTGVWLPNRAKATQTANLTFAYQLRNSGPTVVSTSKLNAAGGYTTSYVLYDSLSRPRQTQSPAVSALATQQGRIVTDTLYDTAGRVWKSYGAYVSDTAVETAIFQPASETDVPAVTVTLFDGAGRTAATILNSGGAEKWRTTTAYGGDRTDTTARAGGTATSTIVDIRGKTVALRQYHGPSPTPTVAGSYDTTTYTFNRKIQLTGLTDTAGNKWLYDYDLRGRQVGVTDPDKGSATSTYNHAGELTSSTDARGETLAYRYDVLGRKTSERDDTATGPKRAEWFFDTLTDGTSVKGQAAKSVRYEPAGSANAYLNEVLGYTANYEPTAITITIPAGETGLNGAYTYRRTYKVDGSLATSTMPTTGDLPQEILSYTYSTLGLSQNVRTNLSSTGDDVDIVNGTTYTRFGELGVVGLRYNGGASLDIGNYYDTATRRRSRVLTTRSTAPTGIADVNYTYDPAGNVTRIVDATANDNQCFSYDQLRRLTEAWTPGDGNCTIPAASAVLGGPASYHLSWTFDSVGNRLNQKEYGTTTGTRTTNYTYPVAAGPKPHILSSTSTQDNSGTASAFYTYDAIGDTLTRPTGSSGSQTLTWDAEGNVATSVDSTGATSYVYDANGNRIVRRDPTGKTLFLPNQELRHTTSSGTRTSTRYYGYAKMTIASRTSAGLSWLINDHHGTASFAVLATTQAITPRRQTPYGRPRGTAPAWPNARGFVGGVADNTGLTHLGARDYDPLIGRFSSVDPILGMDDPQQLEGYTYADSTPTTQSDPSGLKPLCDDASGNGSHGCHDGEQGWHAIPLPKCDLFRLNCPKFVGPTVTKEPTPDCSLAFLKPACNQPHNLTGCSDCYPPPCRDCEYKLREMAGLCIGGGLAKVVAASASACIVFDDQGIGVISSTGVGVGPAAGGFLGVGPIMSNGDIEDQGGPFEFINAGGGAAVGLDGTYSYGQGQDGQYVYSITEMAGVGAGGGVVYGQSETNTFRSWNWPWYHEWVRKAW